MVYTPTWRDTMPIPVEPAVLSVYLINSIGSTNVPVYIPWEYCTLEYAYTVVVVAIDGTGSTQLDLELDAAGGTVMMTITIAKSAAIGDINEATVSNADACKDLGRHNTSRDAVNVEIDGSATGTGSFMLYMYFKSDYAG